MSGPQGPSSPAIHQFSFKKYILSFGIPASSQYFAASSSFGASAFPAKQVTDNFSTGIFNTFVKNSKLIFIASSLKYAPNDQFPNISKYVKCLLSPTSSISFVLKHFW